MFFDTSFVVALENRDDSHHERAKALDRELASEDAKLLLHWGVVLEIGDGFARLGRRSKGVQLIERVCTEHGYLLFPITDTILKNAVELYCQRSDKKWGMTDCVSFVVMRQEGVVEALTADEHYRQAGFVALQLD